MHHPFLNPGAAKSGSSAAITVFSDFNLKVGTGMLCMKGQFQNHSDCALCSPGRYQDLDYTQSGTCKVCNRILFLPSQVLLGALNVLRVNSANERECVACLGCTSGPYDTNKLFKVH